MNVKAQTITEKQIQEWKAKFGRVFKTVVGEQPVIWRKLKRKEYVEIMAKGKDGEKEDNIYTRQDEITKLVTIFPENIAELIEENAGLATCVADEVILKSGFDAAPTEEL